MSDASGDPRRGLQAQDEVLQVMYWLRGEGLSLAVTTADLSRFTGASDLELDGILERLEVLGFARRLFGGATARFELTAEGVREGGRRFADEFADLTKPGHGECGDPECDCRRTGQAEDCRHRV